MGMLGTIFGFLSSASGFLTGLFGSIDKVTAAISNERVAQIKATTEEEKAVINERINALLARRDLMIAEAAQSKLNIYVRTGLALGPASLLLKIFLWDKVIGSFVGCAGKALHAVVSCDTFNTDVLDPNLWNVVMVVVGFYFLADGAATTARILKLK